MARGEFLTNCFIITVNTKNDFIKENSNFHKEVYDSFQMFTDDLLEFCISYDLKTDVESVNSFNTEFEINFYTRNEEYVGSMYAKVTISSELEDYISVRPI